MPPNNDPQTSCHREADRSVQTNHRYYLNPQSIWAWVHSQKPMSIGFFCHVMIYEANDTTEHENKLNKTFHKKKKKQCLISTIKYSWFTVFSWALFSYN
jgi:hypothetical protein